MRSNLNLSSLLKTIKSLEFKRISSKNIIIYYEINNNNVVENTTIVDKILQKFKFKKIHYSSTFISLNNKNVFIYIKLEKDLDIKNKNYLSNLNLENLEIYILSFSKLNVNYIDFKNLLINYEYQYIPITKNNDLVEINHTFIVNNKKVDKNKIVVPSETHDFFKKNFIYEFINKNIKDNTLIKLNLFYYDSAEKREGLYPSIKIFINTNKNFETLDSIKLNLVNNPRIILKLFEESLHDLSIPYKKFTSSKGLAFSFYNI